MKNAINFRSLDALRGILAVYVVLHHARWLLWSGFDLWNAVPHPAWQKLLAYGMATPLRFGHEAVMVFFVLSGFFIHLREAERMAAGKEPAMNAGTFFKRRAHRLVPPYLLALAVTVGLDALGRHLAPGFYAGRTGDVFLDENFGHMGYSARSVVPALCMLPDSLGQNFGSNGPLWSLGYEVVYYLMYPAWLRLRQGGWLPGYGVGGVAAAVASGLAGYGFLPSVLAHYPVWLAGAALAEWVQTPRPALPRYRWMFPVAFLAALGVIVLRLPLPVTIPAYVLGGTATVLAFCTLPDRLAATWPHRVWEGLGQGSYSIYILHFPFLALMGGMMFAYGGHRPLNGWAALGGCIVTLPCCWVGFLACERYFLHRKLPPPAPVAPAPTLTAPLRPASEP